MQKHGLPSYQENVAEGVVLLIVVINNRVAYARNGQHLRFRRRCLEIITHSNVLLGNIPCFFDLPARRCGIQAGLVEVTGAARIDRIRPAQRNATAGVFVRRASRAATISVRCATAESRFRVNQDWTTFHCVGKASRCLRQAQRRRVAAWCGDAP